MEDEGVIVVTGTPPPYFPPNFDPSPYQESPTGGPPPPGSPGGPPPTWLETAATVFGGSHVVVSASVDPNDPAQKAFIDYAQAVMKGLFFNTQFGSKTTIDGPGVHDMSEQDMANLLDRTIITLTTDFVDNRGAKAVAYTDGHFELKIDIDNANVQNAISLWGQDGYHFLFLHEFGHVLGYSQGVNSEANASTYALGLADYAYFSVPSATDLANHGVSLTPF